MPRFTHEQLQARALSALEEAAGKAEEGPIEPTRALKFALAYLANQARTAAPFTQLYWELVSPPLDNTEAQRFGRRQGINSAMNSIYLQLGVQRAH